MAAFDPLPAPAFQLKPALGAALAISSLLALAACSDPGATAAPAPSSGSTTTAGKKGNGLAVAAQAALNTLIKDGGYAEILDRWSLSSEAIKSSELNPPCLPKK